MDFHVERESSDMLTAKGKYALKALIYLSTLEPGEKAQGLAISKAGNIPKKFLDAILAELRDAGVVYPKKAGRRLHAGSSCERHKNRHVVRAIRRSACAHRLRQPLGL